MAKDALKGVVEDILSDLPSTRHRPHQYWSYEFQIKEGGHWTKVADKWTNPQCASEAAGFHLALFPKHIVRLVEV